MMSARKAEIVVLPSSSLIEALISQMHRTESRQGPAATIEACAKDAMRSAMELLRYKRSSAKPMPAIFFSYQMPSSDRQRRRLAVIPVDRRIGVVDQLEIIVAF